MSPYMCPDLICDIDAEDSSYVFLEYKQSDIDKEFAYNSKMWEFTDKIDIKLRLKRENKHIFGYSYGKINYKKSIKFWSRVRSHCKKELKRLKDKGINSKTDFSTITSEEYMTYANYHNQYLNAEDMMNQVRFMRKNKYQEYKLNVKI